MIIETQSNYPPPSGHLLNNHDVDEGSLEIDLGLPQRRATRRNKYKVDPIAILPKASMTLRRVALTLMRATSTLGSSCDKSDNGSDNRD